MAKSLTNIVEISGRLLILETRRIECPEAMTPADWRDYRHLKAQYNNLYHANRKVAYRINYQKIRRASDEGVII